MAKFLSKLGKNGYNIDILFPFRRPLFLNRQN